ncbi:MAG: hypothetical protein MJZ48_04675 [Paludibacteraceae bacterium]|nr:hypothetical protein [Paludibacteraceae bacterium]
MKNALLLVLSTLFTGAVFAESMDEGVTPPPPPKPECHEIVYSKWNDLLFVDNGDEQYVAYQWYKDHNLMEGETKQYLYTEGVVLKGDKHIYHVIVTKKDGKQVMSCEYTFEEFPRSAEENAGVQVRKAALYSYTGRKVGEWTTRQAHVDVAPGMYVWRLTDTEGRSWTEKVVY